MKRLKNFVVPLVIGVLSANLLMSDDTIIPDQNVDDRQESKFQVSGAMEGCGLGITLDGNVFMAPSPGSHSESRIGCRGLISGSNLGPVIVSGVDPFGLIVMQDGKTIKATLSPSSYLGPQIPLDSMKNQLVGKGADFIVKLDLYIVNKNGAIYLEEGNLRAGEVEFGPLREGTVILKFFYGGRALGDYKSSDGSKVMSTNYIIGSIPIDIKMEKGW